MRSTYGQVASKKKKGGKDNDNFSMTTFKGADCNASTTGLAGSRAQSVKSSTSGGEGGNSAGGGSGNTDKGGKSK